MVNAPDIQESAETMRIAIVTARFNEKISSQLLEGTRQHLFEMGCREKNIKIFFVPGAFEIPQVAQRAVSGKKFDAVICLGAVIRGETAHFDYVAGAAARGIAKVSLSSPIPVIFGVLTTTTVKEAEARANIRLGNKGKSFAQAAMDMHRVLRSL